MQCDATLGDFGVGPICRQGRIDSNDQMDVIAHHHVAVNADSKILASSNNRPSIHWRRCSWSRQLYGAIPHDQDRRTQRVVVAGSPGGSIRARAVVMDEAWLLSVGKRLAVDRNLARLLGGGHASASGIVSSADFGVCSLSPHVRKSKDRTRWIDELVIEQGVDGFASGTRRSTLASTIREFEFGLQYSLINIADSNLQSACGVGEG